MSDFTLLDAEAYYQTLLREVPKAQKRIVIAAMIVLWGERTAPIFIMLRDAIKRGVQVTILLDNYTRLPYLYGLKPRAGRGARIQQTLRALEDLSAAGAKVYCLGKQLSFPPYKGRCHIKVTVIDDTSYSFGGVNFFDQVFALQDYMLASKQSEVADCLAQLVDRVGKRPAPLRDGEVVLDPATSVLFDGGQSKRSLIYERACELTAQAKRVLYVSQMAPSGELATLLTETNASIYCNRPEQMLSVDSLVQAFDLQRYRTRNDYQGSDYIHAKFMLFELAGGRKAVLSGSHNFSWHGVTLGTQEIALHSSSPALYKLLTTFVRQHVAGETKAS